MRTLKKIGGGGGGGLCSGSATFVVFVFDHKMIMSFRF